MKSLVTSLICSAIAAVVLTSAADAATLATAPASVSYPTFGARLRCNILNVGPTQDAVTIELYDYSGIVIQSGVFAPMPGETATLSDTTFASYCRFTLTGKKKWRAVAVYDNGTNYTSAIVAR